MITFLLLVYSLLPGLAKIIDNQAPMVLNVPILILLFLMNQKKIRWNRQVDRTMSIFIVYAIFISFISLIFLPSQPLTLFMGIYMYVLPITGYFFAYLIDFEKIVKAIKVIAIVHALFAIFIYPLTPFYPYITAFSTIFRTGVFGERMTSVSGSLGFASLMLISFTVMFFNNKSTKDLFILILTAVGLIFAQQRGAWLGGIIVLVVNFIDKIKTGRLKIKNSALNRGILLGLLGIILIASGVFNVTSLVDRYEDQFGGQAVGERTDQWNGGINNMLNYPFGTGVGQVGQVARVGGWSVFEACADGDYPRVFSEVGIPGLLFYLFLFGMAALIFIYSSFPNIAAKTGFFVFMGISAQMIGSNVTEFYFVSFLYWMFIGYMFSDIKSDNGKMRFS